MHVPAPDLLTADVTLVINNKKKDVNHFLHTLYFIHPVSLLYNLLLLLAQSGVAMADLYLKAIIISSEATNLNYMKRER